MRKAIIIIFFLISSHSQINSQDIHSWFKVDLGVTNNLNYITFRFSEEYILGDSGLILRSSDQGLSWQRMNSNTTENLNSFTGGGAVKIICGDNGTVLRSSDWGVTWNRINIAQNVNLNFTSSIAYIRFWIVGDGGTVLNSLDTGKTWNEINVNTNEKLNFITSSTNNYIMGDNGTILNGNYLDSFNIVTNLTNLNLNSTSISSGSGRVVGDSGFIADRWGGGWNILPKITNENLNFVSENYICGDNSTIIFNDKLQWFPKKTKLSAVYQGSADSVWVVGDSGAVYVRRIDMNKLLNHRIDGNNIKNWVKTDLTFNRDFYIGNHSGFYWPDSINTAIFTSGITISAKVNNSLRISSAYHIGDFLPGIWGANVQDSIFRMYKYKKGIVNFDYDNWGRMVQYGAPYDDVNNNGFYDANMDIPGVKDSEQTLFIHLTERLTGRTNTGFGNTSLPLGCNVSFTIWCYNKDDILKDVIFYKAEFTNKSKDSWKTPLISLINDPELGYVYDDYIGCDTSLNLGYSYNKDNFDDFSGYGENPPAVGVILLKSHSNKLKSFTEFFNSSNHPIQCQTPTIDTLKDYYLLNGFKNTGFSFIDPTNNVSTKYCYSGDPVSGQGWTEFIGSYKECDNNPLILTQNYESDRSFIMSTGSDSITVFPDSTMTIVFAQIIKRGTNNLNSVTKLKEAALYVQQFYDSLETSNEQQIIPTSFDLFQNYPNPFNPVTVIKFAVPVTSTLNLSIFDVSGRRIAKLIHNELYQPGTFEKSWNAIKVPSGIYFYQLEVNGQSFVKKMALIK